MSFDKQGFKNALLSRGIQWDDKQIEDYIALKQSGQKLQQELSQPRDTSIMSQGMNQQYSDQSRLDPLTGLSTTRYGTGLDQSDKNKLYDFAGNFLWEALDTTTFGAIGALDKENTLEDAFTGGGPETFSGRVGAGLGGFAGFLAPFGVTRAASQALVQSGKKGVQTLAKRTIKEGSDFLSQKAGVKKKGYQKFQKLDESGRESFFKPLIGESFSTKIKEGETAKIFLARYNKSINLAIEKQLKKIKITPTDDTVRKIRDIIDKGTSVTGKGGLEGVGSHLAIGTLQQRIALALGGTQGAGKFASVASHALEEGLLFAAVETPMEFLQSIDENRERDLTGRLGHAFALGNALGLIRFTPGGVNWGKKGGIAREAWRRTQESFNKKRPYENLDLGNETAQKQLLKIAKSHWNALGDDAADIFTAKAGDKIVPSLESLKELGSTPEGLKTIVKILKGFDKEWKRQWGSEFSKMVAKDLTGSTPRMLMGSAAFNHEVIFDDNIPLEDKIFHTALGAFMTKGGRKLTYTDGNGYRRTIEGTGSQTELSTKLRLASENLNQLGMKPQDAILLGLLKDYEIREQWINGKGIRENPDVQQINKMAEDLGVIESVNQARSKAPADAGTPGHHPIYERLKAMYDYFGEPGKRMVEVDRLSVKQIKQVEKAFADGRFEALTETAGSNGITKISHIDDIIFKASDLKMSEIINLHVDASVEIFNMLGQRNKRKSQTEVDDAGLVTHRLHHIMLEPGRTSLTPVNREILTKYNRMVDNLNRNGEINLDKDTRRTMYVRNEDFKDLSEIVRQHESKLGELLGGELENSIDSPKLMQEGWIFELIDNQSYFKAVRTMREKLNDISNQSGEWRSFKGIPGNEVLQSFIGKHLTDNQTGYLFKDVEFAGGVKEHQKVFVKNLLHYLSNKSNANVSLLDGMSTTGKTKIGSAEINNLMQVFKRNKIKGFTLENIDQRNKFINDLISYDTQRFLKGAVKKNGEVLHETDIAVLQSLMDMGLVGPNFKMVDVIGVMNEAKKVIDSSTLNMTDNKINNWKITEKEFNDSFREKSPETLELFEQAARETNRTPMDVAKDLFTTYKQIIEPYEVSVVNGKSTGILNTDGTITQLTPGTLSQFVGKLNHVISTKERKTHDQLLTEIETLKSNTKLPNLAKQQLEYLFSQYASGNRSTTELITILGNHKLFDFANNKIKDIDLNNPTLTEQLDLVLSDVDLSFKGNAEGSIIENNIRDYRIGFSKRSEVEIYDNTSKASFISEYNLTKDYDFTKGRKQIIEDAFLKEGDKEIKFADMDTNQQFEFLMDVTKVMNNTGQSKNISRLFAVDGYGVFSQMDYQVYDNSLFRYLDKAGGMDKTTKELESLKLKKEKQINDVDSDTRISSSEKIAIKKTLKRELDKINKDISTGGDQLKLGYSIVDLNLATKTNSVANANTNNTAYQKILSLLSHQDKHIDKDLRVDYDTNKLPYELSEGSIMIRIGDLSFGLAIHKKDLPHFAKTYAKRLSQLKKDYSGKEYVDTIKNLEKTFNNLFSEDKGVYVLKEKSVGPVGKFLNGQANELQLLITHDFMHGNLGKFWMDHSANTYGGKNSKEFAKLFKRIRLMGNLSMKEISNEHVNKTINLLREYKKDAKGKEMVKDLETFRNNDGMDIMIAADESGQASVLKRLKAQVDKARNNKDLSPEDIPNIIEGKDGELTIYEGKDFSEVDSYMAVDSKTMNALYALMGAGNVNNLGGIKPIIHRLGPNALIGKTAFIRDPKMDAFLAKNKVNAILFESGAKINAKTDRSNVFKDWSKLEDFYEAKDGSVLKIDRMDLYKEHLQPKDISLGAVVNSDHAASLPFQAFNHVSGKASPALYDWLVRNNINEFNQNSAQLFSSSDFTQSIALARYLNQSKAVRDSESAYSMFINANGMPTGPLFADNFVNQLKSKFIDKGILKLETQLGGQAVASPGTDLRHTWLTTDANTGVSKVYDYGEISLPNVSGGKRFAKDRATIIDHSASRRDRLITGDKAAAIFKDLNNQSTLLDAFNTLAAYNKANKTNYQIGVVARRNPNTRPGDQPIVGLKEILPEGFGNTVKLNAYDTAMRVEGDYDVDKLDFWWDTPKEVMREWEGLSGEVLRVLPEAESKRTSLHTNGEGASFDNVNSVNNHAKHISYTEKLRGVTVKMQRLMNALRNYNSFDGDILNLNTQGKYENIGGLALSRGKDRGYIYMDSKRIKDSYQLLAEDIQRVTDSYAGFNENVYNIDHYVRNFLFGDGLGANSRYKGLFLKAELDSKTDKVTPNGNRNHKLSELEKDLILEAINPYRDMLQLGTQIYSNGKEQSVRFQDIISHMKVFDGKFKYLKNNAERNMLRKGYTKEEISPYFAKNNQLFGDFGNKVRPNFFKPSDADFSNMLIFERILSKLAYNDKMQLEKLHGLQGSQLREYQEFFDGSMFAEGFSETAGNAIKQLNKENKIFGYMNFLDYRIKSQYALKRNSKNLSEGFVERINESIEDLKQTKMEIEKQLVLVDGESQYKDFFYNLRKGASISVRNEIINNLKVPFKWSDSKVGRFSSNTAAIKYLGTAEGRAALDAYVKQKGIIRFKGMHETSQLELLAWDNIIGKFRDLTVDKDMRGNEKIGELIEESVKQDRKFYAEKYKNYFDGSDWVMDMSRVQSLIYDKIRNSYMTHEAAGGYGRLYLMKLMAPESDPFTYTYYNGRISPGYKTRSLSMIKAGLNFIAKADNQVMTKQSKKEIFSVFAKARNNIMRAHYGQRGERGQWEYDLLSTNENYKKDILEGSPLIDDIKGWEGGMQEMEINPQVAALFGYNNKSLSYNLAHQPLIPEISGKLSELSYLSYMPMGYISNTIHGNRHPSITGWNSYNKAVQADATALLGHGLNLRLLKNKVPNVVESPYKNIQGVDIGTSKKGREGVLDVILDKLERNCY